MLFWEIAGFVGCAVCIIFSGIKLSQLGDQLAVITGWGRAWLGLVLLATVTSLPELISGISAVTLVNAPDLAAGDIFGSCVFNLMILSVLDFILRKPLVSCVKSSHIVVALWGNVLLLLSSAAIYFAPGTPVTAGISWFTPFIIFIYLLSVNSMFHYDKSLKPADVHEGKSGAGAENKSTVIQQFVMHAAIVVGAAVFLPYFGNRIAEHTGLHQSFFGTLFLAATTSLPELVVSIAAVRLGAVDMAVGNLFGSNIFNFFILALDDIFYREGSLYAAISSSHLLSAFIIVLMSTVACLGLLLRPRKKMFWLLSIDTLIILLLYILLMVYLFTRGDAMH